MTSDGSTLVASTTCDGSDSGIIAARACDVTYTELRSATFGLVLNDLVQAQVRARNQIGWGEFSTLNTVGDLVKTEPKVPPSAITEGDDTNDAQIQINWTALAGDDTGQDTITEYKIYWDNGSNGANFVHLRTEISPTFTFTYAFTSGVLRGDDFQFKYAAKN